VCCSLKQNVLKLHLHHVWAHRFSPQWRNTLFHISQTQITHSDAVCGPLRQTTSSQSQQAHFQLVYLIRNQIRQSNDSSNWENEKRMWYSVMQIIKWPLLLLPQLSSVKSYLATKIYNTLRWWCKPSILTSAVKLCSCIWHTTTCKGITLTAADSEEWGLLRSRLPWTKKTDHYTVQQWEQ